MAATSRRRLADFDPELPFGSGVPKPAIRPARSRQEEMQRAAGLA
jgi:hypothetical protein